MINQEEFRKRIAERLVGYRKLNKLTQIELANKLNYSDKAVSKWERAEAVPDIYILNEIANFYGVEVQDFISDNPKNDIKKLAEKKLSKRFKVIISIASCLLVWFAATLIYAITFSLIKTPNRLWLIFLWAFPVMCIVGLIFNWLWGKVVYNIWFVSGISWGIIISLYFTLSFEKLWIFFVAAGVFQVLIVVFFLYIKTKILKDKMKQEFQKKENETLKNEAIE